MLVIAVRDLVFRSKIHASAERLGVAVQGVERPTVLDEILRAG